MHKTFWLSLKVDIEGAELNGMPDWIKSGALERVKLKHSTSSNSADNDDGHLSFKYETNTALRETTIDGFQS